jgi:myo-inositol catabolism protein IolH
MNSEFGRGSSPDGQSCLCSGGTVENSEAAFWKSMDELVPIFEREKINLHIEPHPEDWVETLHPAVDMIRVIDSPRVKFLYCAPHTYYFGDDMAGMIRDAAPVLAHVHVADTMNHKASSGLRYIVNPPGSAARVHQHLDIGQGEVSWDNFFATLSRIGFDGIATVCVFAWEERARESSAYNLEQIRQYLAKHGGRPA